MALDTLFDEEKRLFRMPGEFLILEKPNCWFEIKLNEGITFIGTGLAILTSFRMVLVNIDKKTKAEYPAVEMPLTMIVKEEFDHGIISKDKMRGKCTPIPGKVSGLIEFVLSIESGNIQLFEKVFKDQVQKLRAQQHLKQINTAYQNALATCMYHNKEVIPKKGKDGSFIYTIQPPYYNKSYYLVDLMEQIVPGITEFGKTLGEPAVSDTHKSMNVQFPIVEQPVPPEYFNPNIVPYAPPKKPLEKPVQPPMYPQFSEVVHPEEKQYHSQYPELPPDNYVPPSDINTCIVCNSLVTPESDHRNLSCGHLVHDICLLQIISNALIKNLTIEAVKCNTCGAQLTYHELAIIDETGAGQLYIRSMKY